MDVRLVIARDGDRIAFGVMGAKWVALVGAAALVAGCDTVGGTLAPLHSAMAPGGGVLPPQPRMCQERQGWKPTTTLRLGAALPWPTVHATVGVVVRVSAANHGLLYTVPWVVKGRQFVCQMGYGGGSAGEAHLNVRLTAPGRVVFLSFWREVSPEAASNLEGHLLITR